MNTCAYKNVNVYIHVYIGVYINIYIMYMQINDAIYAITH